MAKAIIIGASGLVGRNLLKLLNANTGYSEIIILQRDLTNIQAAKTSELIIDFDNLENLKIRFQSDDSDIHAFCALGTTIKAAGSQAEMAKVDRDYVVKFAHLCENLNCQSLSIISSLQSDKNSKNFYLRTKGEMEAQVSQLKIKQINIFHPSLLLGERTVTRFAENFAQKLSYFFLPLLRKTLKSYCPVKGVEVAQAMIKASEMNAKGVIHYSNKDILDTSNFIFS